jgi:hypothetical protein
MILPTNNYVAGLAPYPSRAVARRRRGPSILRRRIPFELPHHVAELLVEIPEVIAAIRTHSRLVETRAAMAMIGFGISQNAAARALGVPASRISVQRRLFLEDGPSALQARPVGRPTIELRFRR